MKLKEKYHNLKKYLSAVGDMAVAFSGGTDSVFLLAAALKYSSGRVIAVTVSTPYIQNSIMNDARKAADQLFKNIKKTQHIVENIPVIPKSVLNNPLNRCYECKKVMMKKIIFAAGKNNFFNIVDGSNIDDLNDYRPGLKALKELKIKSPLVECGFTKKDVRIVSRMMNLPTWNKKSSTCLLTRLQYNSRIELPTLKMIESSEKYIEGKGFTNVRIRTIGRSGVIEISKEELSKLAGDEMMQKIYVVLKKNGYEYIVVDPEGYRSGSMNIFYQNGNK